MLPRNGIVTASQPLPAQAGLQILKNGGNAFNAAVATAAVLNVVELRVSKDHMAAGNYQEFLFFTALRQSEVFALEVDDCDLVDGKISITKAVVKGQPKNRTKTNQDREVNLCPRALQVLRAQLSLRAQMNSAGMVNHTRVFLTAIGEPFVDTFLPYRRWTEVLESLPLRYRKPYNSRHSLISWRLMVGHNRLLVAQDDGHSVSTMERTCAAWIKDAKPEDIERIKAAMASRPLTENAGEDRTISKHPNIPRQIATV